MRVTNFRSVVYVLVVEWPLPGGAAMLHIAHLIERRIPEKSKTIVAGLAALSLAALGAGIALLVLGA